MTPLSGINGDQQWSHLKMYYICRNYYKSHDNISNAYGLSPVEMTVEWGQAVKVADVEKQLKGNPDIQGVMIQASETSTTVFHPVKEIAKLTKNGPLLLVDGVTAVGVVPLMMDEWGIDVLVTGSQKALMLPPGLAFVSVSEKAWKQMDKNPAPRTFYFDLKKARAALQKLLMPRNKTQSM